MPDQASIHFIPWIVLLAIVVCLATCVMAFTVHSHLLAQGGARRRLWLMLAGFCVGAGIWAAHFLALLAYAPGPVVGYNLWLAAASFIASIVLTTAGLGVSLRRGRLFAAAGGAIVGLAATAAYFIAVLSVVIAGALEWNLLLSVLAALAGILLGAASMLAYREQTGWRALLSGAALLALAIGLLHSVAMVALTAMPADPASAPSPQLDLSLLAIAIAGMTLLLLLGGYATAAVDRRAMQNTFGRIGELIDAAAEGLVIADDGVIVNVNARVLELSASTRDNLIGKDVFGDLLTDLPAGRRGANNVFAGIHLLTWDGKAVPVEAIRRRMEVPGRGNEVYSIRDMREREEAERELAKANQAVREKELEMRQCGQMLQNALGSMVQGLGMYDADERLVICNERYAAVYGLAPDAIKPGMSLREVVQKRIDNGVYAGKSPKAYMESRLAAVGKPEDITQELNNGRIIAVTRRLISGGGWVTTHRDITERMHMEAQIEQLANHDALTELPSRKSLREQLGECLAKAARHDRRIAVLILGIDRFGAINDALGHGIGDSLLRLIARRLQDSMQRESVLGRYSDDQFIVAATVETSGQDVDELIGKLQNEIRKPLTVEGTTLEVTATIGVTLYPADGADADTLLKNAALALQRAKADRRGSHRFFEPAMSRELKARHSLEQDLSKALDKREFDIHYQPIVDLTRSEITGFEAFLRWNHPTRGSVSPATFIPLAEEIGLINAIEQWTLQRACKQAMEWPKNFTLAVNVSKSRFHAPDLIPSIGKTLAATDFAADRLQIEVTEKVLHENADEALKILRELFDLGVRVVLDDFGAGFSSLTYLRLFPFHKIKIDRSFIARLTDGEDARVIIRTLARLGMGLRLATAAEGVETKEQFDIVRAEGCTEMQGHYFSPPKTAEEISRLLMMKPLGKTDAVA
jgi:diguanylate cyclase (GGDEF)-like protein